MKIPMNDFARLRLMALLFLLASSLLAQDAAPYKSKPRNHGTNQQLATQRLRRQPEEIRGQQGLSRPARTGGRQEQEAGGSDDRKNGRWPKRTLRVHDLIGEASDHAYEALLISFARPSDVHRALQFIGTEPGASFDPGSLRHWAKGESFILSIVRTNEPPLRLEKLLLDRRTGKTLREEGFMFTGSRRVPAPNDPAKKVYAADEYQPKCIVSLFNSTYAVLEVPYPAPKEVVYQNTIVNPEHELPEGALLTLVIEPAQ